MNKLLSLILLLSSLSCLARPITDLVLIPYPIVETLNMEAYADGTHIYIGRQLKNYINNKEQVDFIILHEASHNRLEHIQKTNQSIRDYCNPIQTRESRVSCYEMYKIIFYERYQHQEHQADKLATIILKRLGYESTVCNVHLKMKHLVGEPPKFSTHPLFDERFKRCLDTFEDYEFL